MHVTVCIVGFRNVEDVARCIASVARSTHADYEIVVCENGGADAAVTLGEALAPTLPGGQGCVVLPYDGNSGYAGGNNRCVASRPDSELWWILNPDTVVEPETMALLVAHLAADRADAVGGTLCRADGTVQAYGGRWRTLLARAVSLGQGGAIDRAAAVGELDYILGASLMFTRRFLSVAGPMRDDYFLYGEEVEWGLRAKRRGLRLGVEPRALIFHAQGATTGDGGSFAGKPRLPVFLDQRNKLLILRDTAPLLLPVGAVGSLVALVARAAKNRAWRQLGYGVAGWRDGLLGRRGPPDWLVRSNRD